MPTFAQQSWSLVKNTLELPNWTIRSAIWDEDGMPILDEAGNVIIQEGTQVGTPPPLNLPGPVPPPPPPPGAPAQLDFSKKENSSWIPNVI